jgi:hypothetical protein
MPADGVAITLDGVRKRFGKVEAVKDDDRDPGR